MTAQQRANKRQDAARKGHPRLTLRMSDNESDLLNDVAVFFDSKKSAIIAGLELLKVELLNKKADKE
jgi:hypothetical protein